MKFSNAVKGTPDIKDAFKKGLQALKGEHRRKIILSDSRKCRGSVDIDSHLKGKYPEESRWDYVVGYENRAEFIEVHPALTSNIKEMMKKKEWLDSWLKNNAPLFNGVEKKFHWIATGDVGILHGSPQAKRFAKSGISKPQKILTLR